MAVDKGRDEEDEESDEDGEDEHDESADDDEQDDDSALANADIAATMNSPFDPRNPCFWACSHAASA